MSAGRESAELGLTLGWTLAHALWQTGLLALAYAVWCQHARRASVVWRQGIALAALALGLVAAIATLFSLRTTSEVGLGSGGAPAAGAAGASLVLDAPIVFSTPAVWPTAVDGDRVLSGLVAVWAAGVLLQLVRTLGGLLLVRGIRRRAAPVRREEVLTTGARIAGRLGMARPPSLLHSEEIDAPATWGWLRPVVLIPSELVGGDLEKTLGPLLAHEFAHVRARDFAVNLAQVGLDALLFHCPGARWLSAEARRLREYRCDDQAVALCDRARYVRALAGLADPRRSGFASLAPGAAGPRLVDRVRRLSEGSPMPRPRAWSTLALASAVVTTVLLGSSLLSASRRHVAPRALRTEGTMPRSCPAVLSPPRLTQAAPLPGSEFLPLDAPGQYFDCSPLVLDGKPVDGRSFTVETRGILMLVRGDPGSRAAARIAFRVALRRDGRILVGPRSVLPSRAVVEVDLGEVLASARVGDQLIIDPVNESDWRAKRIIELGC